MHLKMSSGKCGHLLRWIWVSVSVWPFHFLGSGCELVISDVLKLGIRQKRSQLDTNLPSCLPDICHAWCHQMETFSALLAICAGNSLVTGEFPAQRPVTRNLDVFFDLRLNKLLSKLSRHWWFEMPSCSLWLNYNGTNMSKCVQAVPELN